MAKEFCALFVREEKNFQRLSLVSPSVFSLLPDLLFDCLRVLEYAKIRAVLQSNLLCKAKGTAFTIMDKSPWDSNALFIFFCHFWVPS